MLPFPDAILNPNKHVHWAKKNRARVDAREAAYKIARSLDICLSEEKKYRVSLVFCPPDRRSRDLDNLTSAMKSALDGMCRGLGIDDKQIRPLPDWGWQYIGGKVEVVIEELGETDA